MFRIIQFALPYEKTIKLADEDSPHRRTVERIQKITRIDRDGDAFVTPPMATTSALFFEVEQLVRSMFGDPPHLIRDLTAKYRLLRTRAPESYDYGYVIEIGRVTGEFGEERLVAMPQERVEYQSGRYSSGMYSPILCS
jgi:hypothetical protein